MRKFSLIWSVAAIAVAGVLSTSCVRSDNGITRNAPEVVSDDLLDDSYQLVLTSNVASTFTLGTESKTGTEVSFSTTSNPVTVTVKADGYIEQTFEVTFSDENRTFSLPVELMKPSTNQVDQAAAKGATVANDAANQAATDTKAAIEVPGDVTVSGNTTDDFSVTVINKAPEPVQVEELEVNKEESAPIASLVCTPDGATFDKPLTLSAVIEGGEGLEYEVPNAKAGTMKVEGNKVSFQVDHFSVWDILVKATLTAVSEGEETIYETSRRVSNGETTISITYPVYAGFESDATGILADWLIKNFGETKTKIEKTGTVTVENEGSVSIKIKQKFYDFTFKSGDVQFKARVYGEVTSEVNGQVSTAGHSGGSGR